MEKDVRTSQWAVVTGASDGIGFELAKQFALNGFDLLITSEDQQIFAAQAELVASGQKIRAVAADLATPNGVEKVFAAIKDYAGAPDVVVLNAGLGSGGASFDKTDLGKELDLIQVNVASVVHLTKRILPDLISAGNRKLLFTSSIAAFAPGPYQVVYAASKAFVQSFADGLREELRGKGVTVTTLQPGPTETNIFHRAGMDDTLVGESKKDDPAEVARQGFDALMAGKDSVVTGSLLNKVQASLAKIAPQKISTLMHGRQAAPNSPENR